MASPGWRLVSSQLEMISKYLDRALRRAHYSQLSDGTFCATVPGLRGVIATAPSLEGCRDQLSSVVEEWVLVRIYRGLAVPRLGGAKVEVKKAG